MSEETISAEEKEQVRAAVPVWRYGLFPNPQAAVDFVNAPPPQGAGQAVFSVREDGRTDTFYFL